MNQLQLNLDRDYFICVGNTEPHKGRFVHQYETDPDMLAWSLLQPGEMPWWVYFPQSDVSQDDRAQIALRMADGLGAKYMQLKTTDRFGKTWVIQGLENARSIASVPSIEHYVDRFKGKPAIIVSPGPSLSKNLAQLPALADRVVIIAGTHSLTALHSVGITPDITMAADPGKHAHRIVGDLKGLALAAMVRHDYFDLPCEQAFTFAGNGRADAWLYGGLKEDAALPTGGSVSCSALSMAMKMGCNPIILVGQDLALTDGKYYAAESEDGDRTVGALPDGSFHVLSDGKPTTQNQRGVVVPGYHGGQVATSQSFQAFLVWFTAMAEKNTEFRMVNATEGGAYIQGMEHIPLSSVEFGEPFDKSLTVDFDANKRWGMLRKHLQSMLRAMTPCEFHVSAALKMHEEIVNGTRANDDVKHHEEMLSKLTNSMPIFALYSQSEFIESQVASANGDPMGVRRMMHLLQRSIGFFRGPLVEAIG